MTREITQAVLAAAVVLALAGAVGAQKGVTFGNRQYATADSPRRAAAGDLDGDGARDLVVAHGTIQNYGVSVLRGDGGAGFGPYTFVPTGHPALDIALGDVDGDGALDAVTISEDKFWTVLRGDGRGGLTLLGSGPVLANAKRLALGDIDGDGRLDIAVNGLDSVLDLFQVQVLLGDGAGAFVADATYVENGATTEIALGDLDADGDLDLVAARVYTEAINIFLNDGAGDLGSAIAAGAVMPNNSEAALTLVDFDGDGALDVVVGSQLYLYTRLLRGDGSGGIASETEFGDLMTQTVADVNGDGVLDLVGTGFQFDLSVALGDGAGGVLLATEYGIGPFGALLATRLDGDQLADIVPLFPTRDGVSVVPGRALGPPAGVDAVALDGATSRDLQAGDVNGDGRPDVLVSRNFGASGSLAVLINGGKNVFYPFVAPISTTFKITRFVLRNVGIDPALDVLALSSGDALLHVLKGNGTGGFSPTLTFSTGATSGTCLAAGDLNGDGFDDVVVGKGGVSAPAVAVLLGNGNGGFGTQVTYPIGGDDPADVALGDLDGDGHLDVVTCNRFDKNVSVLLGDGNGGLLSATEFEAGVGQGPLDVEIADVDGDGALDVVTANFISRTVSVLSGDGAGALAAGVNYTTADDPRVVDASDVDADGDLDLLVTCDGDDELDVLLNDGSGAFPTQGAILLDDVPHQSIDIQPGSVVADFTLDGRPDFVTVADDTNSSNELVDVRVNLGPPPFALPWSDLGGALAGVAGKPLLTGKGGLHAGEPGALYVTSVAAAAPALLLVSIGSVPLPFKGGTLQALPAVIAQPLSTGAGSITIWFTWPPGVPPAIGLVFQCAVADAAAVQGVALSNALGALTP